MELAQGRKRTDTLVMDRPEDASPFVVVEAIPRKSSERVVRLCVLLVLVIVSAIMIAEFVLGNALLNIPIFRDWVIFVCEKH